MTQLVLWDIDGTLVHAGDVAGVIFGQTIERITGLRPIGHVRMSGKTDPQITREYLQMMGIEDIEPPLHEILQALPGDLARQRSLIREQGRVLPGVCEALDAVDAIGEIEQTLLTGNLEENARIKLEVFGLDRRFDFAVGAFGSDHIERTRLVPVVLERFWRLRQRKISPHEVLVIGDSPNDLACARAGGTRCLLVATGRSSFDELSGLEPDFVMEDLKDTSAFVQALS
ncbi:MAG TPA: HAD family hydrolase [Acidimicrobiales bacterium]|nr:HAD family hydrolase [Acidimicrobiales bacterium]